MPEIDDILQKGLEAMEKGLPLQQVQASFPGEAAEIESLLRLSTDLRSLPHPQPQVPAAEAWQQIEQAYSRRTWDEKTQPVPIRNQPSRSPAFPWGRLNAVYMFSGATMVFMVTFVALLIAGIWLNGVSRAQASADLEVSGQAMLTSTTSPGQWLPAESGDHLRAGQRLRTGPNSKVSMRFYDGSLVTLSSGSDVIIERLKGGWSNSLQLVLVQTAGISYHDVTPLQGSRSKYEVITPSGAASVRGTSFSVAVEDSRYSRIAVETGEVVVQHGKEQVTLGAGQATIASASEITMDAAYQFTLVGPLTSMGSEGWAVNGVDFKVTPVTRITGDPDLGVQVLVEGRFLYGEPTADRILVLSAGQSESTFTGILENMDGEFWTVEGKEIQVTSGTKLVGELREDIPVKVIFTVLSDGTWMALEVISLEEEPEDDATPTPTATTEGNTPTPTSTLEGTATPTVFVNCTGANPQPKGQTLADLYKVPYEEIMGWFCQNFGFGEIDLAYGLSRQYGIPVEQIFDMRRMGLGWGEIKKQVPVITPWITVTSTITSTVTVTPTATPTATLTLTPEPTRTGGNCPGTNVHPTGNRLAFELGVPYETIMTWFCRGFGFGEIEKAYQLSAQTGVQVDVIFAMRTAGMGWGQIESELGNKQKVNPNKPVKTKKPK